ncbi:MAG: GNAT family N-acetyltransferase [Bacteroidia bacterium]
MRFEHSTAADIEKLFELYEIAIDFQKKVSEQHWLPFEKGLVEKEISEKRQYKIIIDQQVACIFCIAWNDPLIWGERDKEPSVYVHRIVTDPAFRGRNFVNEIVRWALNFCRENDRKYLRMDTWGDNDKLRDYYSKCGFELLGVVKPASPHLLPAHYSSISLSLFQITV